MLHRPRRLRKTSMIREMVAETHLSRNMLVYPYFVASGNNIKTPIQSLPGINHFSVDTLVQDVEKGLKDGLNKVLLFGVGETKTENGVMAYSKENIVAKAVKELKKQFKEDIYVITDVCACAYTTHGHCGIIKNNYVQNDESVQLMSKIALSHAEAGADMVAPSDMMDGRVLAIRDTLDENKWEDTAMMSYAIKYASAYYGPFREAAGSSPQFGDRKTYQMDYRNPNESLKEALIDENEGADILMVKPALAYLDIIYRLKSTTLLPVACYNVSGEYAMIKFAAQNNLIDERNIVIENMNAFVRSGSNIIITYHAKDIVQNNWC